MIILCDTKNEEWRNHNFHLDVKITSDVKNRWKTSILEMLKHGKISAQKAKKWRDVSTYHCSLPFIYASILQLLLNFSDTRGCIFQAAVMKYYTIIDLSNKNLLPQFWKSKDKNQGVSRLVPAKEDRRKIRRRLFPFGNKWPPSPLFLFIFPVCACLSHTHITIFPPSKDISHTRLRSPWPLLTGIPL